MQEEMAINISDLNLKRMKDSPYIVVVLKISSRMASKRQKHRSKANFYETRTA